MEVATRNADRGILGAATAGKPVTMVVRRHVKPGCESAFEAAIQEFVRLALAAPGNRGIHVLRPDPRISRQYTILDRFSDCRARQAFRESPDYRHWVRQLRDLTEGEPYMRELGGLARTISPSEGTSTPWRKRVSIALITFASVYSLMLLTALVWPSK
jgi:antibiotic biosynthesis monooxygenase (ABM) superfamily enzyme